MSEVTEHIKKKRRKYWKILPKNIKGDRSIKYIAIDPNTYQVINIFDGIGEVEFATNRKNLQPLMLKHIQNQFSKTGSPLLCGWIFIRMTEKETAELSIEDFEKEILKRAIDKIIMMQLQRIRDNMSTAFTIRDKMIIHNFLNNVESPNSTDINIKITL